MLVIRCRDPLVCRQIVAPFAASDVLMAHDTWERLAEHRTIAGAYIIHADPVHAAEWQTTLQRLRELQTAAPDTALVVVTERSADRARDLLPVRIDALVWTGSVRDELAMAVETTRSTTIPTRLARQALSNRQLSQQLRRALALLFESPAPIGTVSELASLAGCHRSTLIVAWRKVATGPRSLDWVIDAALCLRLGLAKRPSRSWAFVCESLRIPPRRAGRPVRRVLGRPLAALDRSAIAELQDVLEQLVGSRGAA
jgi:hypothetical protein